MSKTLDRIATQDARVSDVEDAGRDEESRYWIYLRAGWRSPADDSHTITARTVTEARQSLAAVVKCICRDCRGDAR